MDVQVAEVPNGQLTQLVGVGERLDHQHLDVGAAAAPRRAPTAGPSVWPEAADDVAKGPPRIVATPLGPGLRLHLAWLVERLAGIHHASAAIAGKLVKVPADSVLEEHPLGP